MSETKRRQQEVEVSWSAFASTFSVRPKKHEEQP